MSKEIIAVDIETTDPNLTKAGPLKFDMGPGDIRKDGKILGVAVYEKGGTPEYLQPGVKKDRARLVRILKTDTPKVLHNGMYDLSWLQSEGLEVRGRIHDTVITSSLLDEYSPSFRLDDLSLRYLGERKGTDGIAEYAKNHGFPGVPQNHLEKMPVELVGEYAKKDVDLTLRLLDRHLPDIQVQELREVYDLECSLFPLMLKMRKTGIRMDVPALFSLGMDIEKGETELKEKFIQKYGRDVNIKSGKQIADLMDARGIQYPRTEKGNPKLGAEELKEIPELGEDILERRSLRTLQGNFIRGAFPRFLIGDRIHPLFVQTKRDEGGAVTGRMSCQTPNLQQVPVRDEVWGPRIRGLFLPEEGYDLLALDYDGIESRIFAHYAEAGEALRQSYRDNPELDYHQFVADMAELTRRLAKTINFAALYGAGAVKLARAMGVDLIRGKAILTQYHTKFPAVRATMASVEREVRTNRYIRTVSGRKARLTNLMLWEKKFYLFLNRKIQGSSADLLKKGMADAWKAGIFDVIIPHLLVHDEFVGSVPRTPEGEEAEKELREIMQNAYEFRVPIRVSGSRGQNWAEAH